MFFQVMAGGGMLMALLSLLALPLAILLTRAEAKAPLHNLRAFHGFMEVHNRTYHSR